MVTGTADAGGYGATTEDFIDRRYGEQYEKGTVSQFNGCKNRRGMPSSA